ncbi:MAG: thermonuclease family protein [Planctomycetes bacterium]|nr:thermonuclease family protein [Planctomycetota bacterium]
MPGGLKTAVPSKQTIPASSVKALDGDTVRIGDEKIRLLGIDTPEKANKDRFHGDQEPYASMAEDHLRKLIKEAGEIQIRRLDKPDPYGRTLGYLYAGKRNLNAEMIRAGHAWETVSHYGPQGMKEEAAEIRKAWDEVDKPKFMLPHEWRKKNQR